MDKIDFDKRFFDRIFKIGNSFKINICISTENFKVSIIYTLIHNYSEGKYIWHLCNKDISFTSCRLEKEKSIEDIIQVIKSDFAMFDEKPYNLVFLDEKFN